MKSSYELAMERLAASDPEAVKPISEAQREALGKVTEKYRAKRAEREVFLQGKLSDARQSQDFEAVAQLERQFRDEVEALKEAEEAEREKIRNGG
ncbi:MAG: hypothetical protein ACFCU4_10295 [Puniceicoccaceae bacterium]